MKRLIAAAAIVVCMVAGCAPAQAATSTKTKGQPNINSVVHRLPPCLFDEVTEVDCYWNAKKQGNGQGQSFVVIDGVLTYVR